MYPTKQTHEFIMKFERQNFENSGIFEKSAMKSIMAKAEGL